ncbi:MAG: ammonium transporter [Proteobacteria bacterium]|nr:ammonium transporter [Pseudomonadota bacterium]
MKPILKLLPLLGLLPALAAADELNTGDTAWMLTSTALVLMMTIPGLSLFYAGMVRAKNALSVMMQCFAITALVTIIWTLYGYSLAFSDGGALQSFVGGLSNVLFSSVGVDSLSGTIPETVFAMFQLTFAIITPALIVGAFAERMKFSAMLWFTAIWVTVVYFPVAHWVWGGGWLGEAGALDFAGGTVVHINAGVAGLVAALVLGKRKGFPTTAMPPHSLMFTLVGASMLWVGWFGFNAGSELAADGVSGMAMFVTQIATAAAALTWTFAEWVRHGKPSALGIASGAVGGLVAITPAAGFVGPGGALVIGIVAGFGCFWGATTLKKKMGYDDSLDCFGVHGIGGIIGALLTGVFVAESLGGSGLAEGMTMLGQLWVQFYAIVATVIYDAILTFAILKALDVLIGLRVDEEQETEGLDVAQHGERGYTF